MYLTQVLWYKPVIPALRRQRGMNYEFKASLSYIKPCLKWKKKKGAHIYQLASHTTGSEPGASSVSVYVRVSCVKSAGISVWFGCLFLWEFDEYVGRKRNVGKTK